MITMSDNRPFPDMDVSEIPSPCYVLDERLLIKNLTLLNNIAQEARIKILCALKGYSMWSTFPLLKQYLNGLTASSLNEARLTVDKFGNKAHLCAPVYLENEIDEITDLASHITFNSLHQYHRFYSIAKKKNLKIALRINPEYSEVDTALYNPCMPGSRLGITRKEFGDVLPPGVTGLHFHALCEQNAIALKNTLHAVEEKFGDFLRQIEWINIGGGHHFTRIDYDIPLFINTIKQFSEKHHLEIIAEPGEAVGWQTGYLISTVQDIIHANNYKTAMLDVSFSAHMPDCLEMPYKPKIWGATDPQKGKPTYRMGGLTCLAGDFIGDYSFEQELKPGDSLIFDDMIHYTMVKTTTFNGVNLPSIGAIDLTGKFKIIKKFGFEDFKSRLS